jgi:hypothetical protein
MQFEVPQFIEIEDKIFGPLTWRQFLYLGGGGAMAVVLFLIAPFIIFLIVGLPLGLLALALAFYPVNNRPFSDLLEAIYNFFLRKRVYHWRQANAMVYKQSASERAQSNPYDFTTKSEKKDIASLARRLELDALQKK